MGQVTSAALFVEDEVPDYLLALFEFMVLAISLEEGKEFNPLVDFAKLFLVTKPKELPSLGTISHRI